MGQPDLLETEHLVDDEAVVDEQAGPSDPDQVGQQLPQTPQPLDPIEQKVLGDLAQLGETPGLEVLLGGFLHEHYLHITFHHRAIRQFGQVGHVIAHIDALADSRTREVHTQQQREGDEPQIHLGITRSNLESPLGKFQKTYLQVY